MRSCTPAPTELAGAASVTLESKDLEELQPRALSTALRQEREVRDADQEMVDDGNSDDSNDEDYVDMSDAAASEMRSRPRSRKRAKRAKDTEHNDVETPSTHSLNISCQAIATASTGSIQESEEILIHGYLTLKTIESKVVYCLTFSQELLPESSGTSQRRDITKSVSSRNNRRDSERLPEYPP
ncbi:hypothetical protein B7463_g10151, partial [Scytalidium lignicola]